MIVLDTNILSELMRPSPAAPVSRWIAAQPVADLFITTITQAEILFGLELTPAGRRRNALQAAAEPVFREDFGDRILSFDGAAPRRYAAILSARRRLGRPIATLDAQIAAIASSQGASIATRNVTDFDDCGLTIIDPWGY